jgi:hypothetical protein
MKPRWRLNFELHFVYTNKILHFLRLIPALSQRGFHFHSAYSNELKSVGNETPMPFKLRN